MSIQKFFAVLFVLFITTSLAHAALPQGWQSPTDLVGGAMNDAMKQISSTLEKAVISIIFALAFLQMAIIGIKQMGAGDIEKPFMSFIMNFIWVGFALWLLATAVNPVEPGVTNLGDLLWRIQHFGISTVTQMLGGFDFSAGAILAIGLQSYGFITLAVGKATSTNLVNALAALFMPGVSFMTILITFSVSVTIIFSCGYLAMKVFITKIEFAILVTLAPINVALLVFGPTREQGWAPFRGAVSLLYRVLILGGTVAAISIVAKSLASYVDGLSFGVVADVYTPLISAAFSFALLAFVAHKSDQIASSMASGSSNLSSGDMAGAVAMGVGAAMTGGAALAAAKAAGTGGAGIKAMSDVMKNMHDASPVARGASAMRKALGIGSSGSGGAPAPKAPPRPDLSKHPEPPVSAAPSGSGNDSAPPPQGMRGGDDSPAGIGGNSEQTPQQQALAEHIGKMMDRAGNLNQKVERDTSGTSVNISGHHGFD